MFDRDREVRTSKALWIPVVWVLFAILAPRWLHVETENSIDALEGNPIETRVFAGLLAAGLIVLIARGREVLTLLWMNWPIVLFFAYCLVSTVWSDFPAVSFRRWVKSLGDVVIVLIILSDPSRTAAIKRFLARTGFLLIPVSVLLIRFTSLGAMYKFQDGKKVFTGVTNDKNLLGVVCLIFGLGAAWRFLHSLRETSELGSRRQLVANGVVLAMAFWLFAKAGSMTSLACFVLASSLIAATGFFGLARTRVVHLLVVAALAVASLAFFDAGSGLIETMGRASTLTGRTDLWKQILGMTGNPLFGTGFESFWTGSRLDEIWRLYWSHPAEAHNGYIEVFLNLGWVGVALLTIVLVTGYRNAIATLRSDQYVGELRLAFFVIGVMYSYTEAGFKLLNPVWIAFLLGALAIPQLSQTSDPVAEPVAQPVAPPYRMAIATSYRVPAARRESRFPARAPAGKSAIVT